MRHDLPPLFPLLFFPKALITTYPATSIYSFVVVGGGVVLFYFFGFGFFVWLGFFGLCMLEITLQEGMDFHLFCFVFSFLCIQLGLSK